VNELVAQAARQRRATVLLLVVSALTQIVTYVARPAATYRAIELNVPPAWLGALAASYAIVPLGLAIPSGALTDRIGERRVAVSGGLLLCFSTLSFLIVGTSVSGLILGTMLLGTGQLFCVVAQQALVANTSDRRSLDAAFGRYTFAASLGQAIGPGLIIGFGGSREIPNTGAIFTSSVAICVVLTLLSFGLGHRRSPAGLARQEATGSVRTLLRLPGLARALVTSSVILAAVDISLVYLPALGAEHQLSSSLIGLLLALRAGASMVSRLFLGRLTALIGRRRLLVVSTLIAAISTALIPLPMPIPLIAVAVVLTGFGLGVGQPVTMAWLAEASPPGLRGRSMSLRLVGNRTGQLLIPSAVGVVAVGLGSAGVLWVTAAALAVVAVSARRITQNPLNPPPPQPA
jgi:MFS family permease